MANDTVDLRSRQVDGAIAEFLEGVERGAPPDREEFLARHADIAADLGEFLTNHRAVGQGRPRSDVNAPTVDHAVSTDVVLANTPARIGPIIRAGTSSQLEIQTVLRKRLLLIALLFIASSGMGLVNVTLNYGFDLKFWGIMAAVEFSFAFCAWQCRRPKISLRALRWIEAGMFAFIMVSLASQDRIFVQSGWYSRLASFHYEGIAISGRYVNMGWAVLIILYGILIPNTARRCFAAVTLAILIRLAILAAIVLSVPDIAPSDNAMLLGGSAVAMIFAAVIAIFGAHRIESLRRTASEARNLGPYQLTRRLGSGGMGEVYLAQHALLRRPCALKLIRPDQVGDRSTLARFEREVQTMAALTHPNTVRVYDYGLSADGTFYYAMEYLPGLSLHELVTAHGPLPPARAVHILRQVCEALREAHAVGLVHRDIKPANILACKIGGVDDVAKLLDFGLVREHTSGANGANLTRVGSIAGTPAFMSPEQAAGNADVDARSDIYSLGAVAYFLLTGRPPFVRSTSVETMTAHLVEPVVAPRLLCTDIPGDLDEVIVRCLAKRREQRFSDVTSVEQALARCECREGWTLAQACDWWQSSSNAEASNGEVEVKNDR